MILEFKDDIACRYIDLQYMLGRELLVAPVFNADGEVNVYLPRAQWFNWWNGEVTEGGRYYRIVVLWKYPLTRFHSTCGKTLSFRWRTQ
ncbi:hypothetical protein [Alicyclobacillus macrosporangiidus]|uniref:hypothetical protein n=1 Tax=Alicyclobacillus macrosporangiidus TaxID=392015 RepID=UPI0034E978D8